MKTVLIPLLILLVAGCQQASTPSDQVFSDAVYLGNVSSVYRIGALGDAPAPTDFSWRDSSGVVHSLSEYKGHDVLLNFWATWCGYCVAEMPALQDISRDSTAVVIGVSTDNAGNTFRTVQDFIRGNKISYQIVIDSSQSLYIDYIAQSGGTSGIPETYVIGKDGTIKFLLIGQQSEQSFRYRIALAN